jgi:hypothetical protein
LHTALQQVTVPLRLEEVDCSSVHDAVRRDHFGCLRVLLAKEPAAALQLDEHGETPLHCVEHTLPRCHAVTAALLSAQPAAAVAAVINAVDRQQRTALQRVLFLTPTQYPRRRVCQQCLLVLCAAGADASTASLPRAVKNSCGRGRYYSLTGSSLVEAVLLTGDTEHSGSTEEQRRSAAAATARITALLQALQQGSLDVNDDCYLHMFAAAEYSDSVAALLACGANVHKGACLQVQVQLSGASTAVTSHSHAAKCLMYANLALQSLV